MTMVPVPVRSGGDRVEVQSTVVDEEFLFAPGFVGEEGPWRRRSGGLFPGAAALYSQKLREEVLAERLKAVSVASSEPGHFSMASARRGAVGQRVSRKSSMQSAKLGKVATD